MMIRLNQYLNGFLVISLILMGCGCRHSSRYSHTSGQSECETSFTNKQISEIVHKAMRAADPKFAGFGARYRESVHRQGCNYVFIAAFQGREAIEDIVIIVDSAGRIKSIPLCCYTQDCPELCVQPNPTK